MVNGALALFQRGPLSPKGKVELTLEQKVRSRTDKEVLESGRDYNDEEMVANRGSVSVVQTKRLFTANFVELKLLLEEAQ